MMPGMGASLQTKNPVVVSAFHTALLHQLFFVVLVLVVLTLVWNVLRTTQFRREVVRGVADAPRRRATAPESAARFVLRVGFGLLWVLDGLLQLQSSMPLGLPGGVLQPSDQGSPTWVQDVVNFGARVWSDHPVQAAAAAVWIQVGLGAMLLVAPRGRWSRLAGLASLAWGLMVWVVGESFGGIFAPGSSWLFGTPGAAVFYAAAGLLVALPESAWTTGRLGRGMVRALGAFLVGMAVLQAWPGRGSWQGATGPGGAGSLTSMVRQMVQTPQPGWLSSWLSAFGRFDAAHGWAVNLFVVVALGVLGAGFLVADRRLLGATTAATVVVCLADWVLVQDMGFFGGVGTDPNSMVPMVLFAVAGCLAVRRALMPAPARRPVAPAPETGGETDDGASERPWWDRLAPLSLARVLAAVAAAAIVLVGAVPMAAAAANPNADPILAEAVDGTPDTVNLPAPAFQLVDQSGRPVSLASLRGRVIALTFLDPVCTSDCPVIAQEFKAASALLGPDARRVVFAAVVANPIYRAVSFTDAFDRQEGLEHMANWLYLTGSVEVLQKVWDDYGVEAEVEPAGAMVDHSELAYLIDGRGRTREVLSADPGDGVAANSSFSDYLADAIENVLHR